MSNTRAARYITVGQISLFGCSVLCMLLLPAGILTNDGLSYYGVYRQTIVPYYLGLTLSAWFIFKLAKELTHPSRYLLFVTAGLLVGLLLTPYTLNRSFWEVHVYLGSLLFLNQYALMWWLALRIRRDLTGSVLMIAATLELYITGHYLSSATGFLVVGQLVFQILFGLALYRGYVSNPNSSGLYVKIT